MRVLLVGAGAVGQVYGLHLQRAGAHLGFFVKPIYAEAAKTGFRVYPNGSPSVTLRADEILTDVAEVAASSWDQIWLCTSSPALRAGWLGPLLAAAGTATIVMLQPGLADRALLLQHVPEARLVTGLISFMAWQAPLPGEQVDPPGLRYWFPPLSKSLFSGPDAKRTATALQKGGCPADAVANAGAMGALGSAVLLTTIAALERADWSLAAWRAGPDGRAGVAAAREALAIAGAYHQTRPGPLALLTWWPLLSLISRVAPRVVPTNLEVYFRYHFTKVGDQTRAALGEWAAEGQRRGMATTALVALAAGMPEI